EAADVVEYPPALSDRRDDRAQAVIGEYQVGGLLGDLGAAAAHRDADISGAQCGGVVDPVTGHRDDVAGALPGGHDVELAAGIGAGIDAAQCMDEIWWWIVVR